MRFLVLAACVLAGCAQLSGLDGLGVCDGASCGDATTDASTTEGGGLDATIPDASTPDADAGNLKLLKGAKCKQPADCFGLADDAAVSPTAGGVCCELVPPPAFTCLTDAGLDAALCSPTADCPTKIGTGCASQQVRLCAFDSECLESGYDRCCSFPLSDAGPILHICASAQLAQLVGGSCP